MDTTIKVRVDKALKEKAEANFKAMGINMSVAVRTMLNIAAEEGRLPYEFRVPSAKVQATMRKIEQGKYTKIDSLQDLFDEIDAE